MSSHKQTFIYESICFNANMILKRLCHRIKKEIILIGLWMKFFQEEASLYFFRLTELIELTILLLFSVCLIQYQNLLVHITVK